MFYEQGIAFSALNVNIAFLCCHWACLTCGCSMATIGSYGCAGSRWRWIDVFCIYSLLYIALASSVQNLAKRRWTSIRGESRNDACSWMGLWIESIAIHPNLTSIVVVEQRENTQQFTQHNIRLFTHWKFGAWKTHVPSMADPTKMLLSCITGNVGFTQSN